MIPWYGRQGRHAMVLEAFEVCSTGLTRLNVSVRSWRFTTWFWGGSHNNGCHVGNGPVARIWRGRSNLPFCTRSHCLQLCEKLSSGTGFNNSLFYPSMNTLTTLNDPNLAYKVIHLMDSKGVHPDHVNLTYFIGEYTWLSIFWYLIRNCKEHPWFVLRLQFGALTRTWWGRHKFFQFMLNACYRVGRAARTIAWHLQVRQICRNSSRRPNLQHPHYDLLSDVYVSRTALQFNSNPVDDLQKLPMLYRARNKIAEIDGDVAFTSGTTAQISALLMSGGKPTCHRLTHNFRKPKRGKRIGSNRTNDSRRKSRRRCLCPTHGLFWC